MLVKRLSAQRRDGRWSSLWKMVAPVGTLHGVVGGARDPFVDLLDALWLPHYPGFRERLPRAETSGISAPLLLSTGRA
jgi:hypothetical protein